MQTQRIDIAKVTPGAYQSLIELDKYVSETNLSKSLYHLIKVRSSIINGCALCIQSHTKDALSDGETTKRLLALNAWEDSPYFTEEEKAILALTDETTLISKVVFQMKFSTMPSKSWAKKKFHMLLWLSPVSMHGTELAEQHY
ncbi:carboxymuconolactone decarboxylase family protein [Flavobacterium hydrophilum]|uniref:carboxymuconolactone decarboxylase family protein n=1 Tax=Flavobacterium hydrophilum TaxID=2211445 RepID=UPI0018C8B6DB|nr:carboxymuconolactone decarboxylase family protein [Flavobacterium hydrophilum]